MQPDLVDGRLDRGELRQDLLAVGAFLEHPLHAAQLTLRAAQAYHELVGAGCRRRHGRP